MTFDEADNDFFTELAEVNKDINPADYTEDYDDIDFINSKSINELKEMLLADGSQVYNEDGSVKGPNAAYSRLLKLLEHKKNQAERGIRCSDDLTDWY